jgi:D-glycero-D-manno-heptose 1,7-bisphosphate phosphatase
MKKIVFLDRDGVINKKAAPHQYVTRVEDFKFNPRIFELLANFKKSGYEFIVITNQRGISRKMLTEADLKKIHDFMLSEFAKKGISILDIFYCPHGEGECDCRKPKPGLLKMACEKYDIDLKNSILISDSPEDVIMGEKFGVGKNYLVGQDKIC